MEDERETDRQIGRQIYSDQTSDYTVQCSAVQYAMVYHIRCTSTKKNAYG
jgi:hypothetical protein